MTATDIDVLLQKAMGLKVTSIGQATLDRAVNRRMKVLDIDDRDAYVAKLNASVLELKELIEEVVIPETWFFRDKKPFEALQEYLVKRWAPSHKQGVMRLLSVPCSTGEEPYSLAISLLKSGWPPNRFQIHAVDISSRSLSRAREALYTDHSFRGLDDNFKKTYFSKTDKFYHLNQNVRQKVQFHHGNILNPLFMESMGVFDVIFCRNVLIYFDAKSRSQAIATIGHMLSPSGILFVGHAEASLFVGSPFEPAHFTQAFAFYKREKRDEKIPVPDLSKLDAYLKRQTQPAPATRQKQPDSPPQQLQNSSTTIDNLQKARQLADQGNLQEAAEICEASLRQQGPTAQAYFLLGVTRDALGEAKLAEQYLRKAIYLNPNHTDALTLLALLAEKKGDLKSADTFKQRLRRVEATGK